MIGVSWEKGNKKRNVGEVYLVLFVGNIFGKLESIVRG